MTALLISSSDIYSTYGGGQVYFKNIVHGFINKNTPIAIACPGEDREVSYKGNTIHYFNAANLEITLRQIINNVKPSVIHAHGFKGAVSRIGHELYIPVVITAHHGGILCPVGALLNHKDEICHVKASHNNCLPCVINNIRGGNYAYPIIRQLPTKKALKISNWIKEKPFIPYLSPVLGARGSIQKKFDEWQQIIDYSQQMIAPSDAIAKAMILNGYPEENLKVIPHGIPLRAREYEVKKKPNKKWQLFYLGRINKVKGVHVLCEAMNTIQGDFDLHIYGNASTKEEKRYQKALKEKFKYDKRIHWQGGVAKDEVFGIIAQMDVMIHPAIFMEIYGLNIAETLAMGLPVVATRCGGAEMQIENGVNGLLVEPNNPSELAHAIQAVLDNEFTFKVDTKQVITIDEHVEELKNVYEALSD